MNIPMALLLGLAVVQGVQANELTIIADSGDTRPIAPYVIEAMPEPAEPPAPSSLLAVPAVITLPITTPSMQPGAVAVTAHSLRYIDPPLFLVGSDTHSRRWLQTHREQLRQMGAIGLLVAAESQADVDAMIQLAEGVRLIPASAEGFARPLGLTHYPVLLSKDGWEQ